MHHVTVDSPSTSSSSLARSALTGSTSSTRPTSSPRQLYRHRHRPSACDHRNHRPAGGRAECRPEGPCVEVRTIPCPRPATNRKTSKCDTRNRPRPVVSLTILHLIPSLPHGEPRKTASSPSTPHPLPTPECPSPGIYSTPTRSRPTRHQRASGVSTSHAYCHSELLDESEVERMFSA
jgi:hypothetical protein